MNTARHETTSPKFLNAIFVAALAVIAAVVLVFSGASIAAAANSSNHGRSYDHIDVKIAASYTVTIDGVKYVLSGQPVKSSISVWIDKDKDAVVDRGETFDFDSSSARYEDGLYEYNLSTESLSPDHINWGSGDGFWKMDNVYVTATIKLDEDELKKHLGDAAIEHLLDLGLIDEDAGSYYVYLDDQQYAGVQECTGGNGMRSDGKTGTPTGLDLIFSAEDTALALTKGKLVISKIVEGEESGVPFKFTLEYFESATDTSGEYVKFASNAYVDKSAEYTKDTDGVIVTVSSGSSVTLTDLPAGIYKVTELQDVTGGYIVSAVDGAATTSYTKNYTVETKQDSEIPVATFTNKKISDNQAGLSIKKVSEGTLPEGASYPNPHVTITEKESGAVIWNGELPANGDTYYINQLLEKGKTYVVTEAAAAVPGTADNASLFAVSGATISGMEFTVTADKQQIALTLSNEYVPTTSVSVKKVWDDKNDVAGFRPQSVTVHLLADGVEVGEEIILSGSNNWAATWSNLPVTKNGKTIAYTVSEDAVSNYSTSIDGSVSEGFVITNTHVPEMISINGTKTWDDNDNALGNRPEKVTIRLYANGEYLKSAEITGTTNVWSYSFSDLPKYKDGVEVMYTVTEDLGNSPEVANNTTVTINGFDITNKYTRGETSIEVLKKWDDGNDQDGLRPDAVEVVLYENGEKTDKSITLSAANNWQGVFTELPEVQGNELIVYSVKEADVPEGYTSSVTGDMAQGYVITNTHKPVTTEVKGVKEWDDADNQDGVRPDSVTIYLYAATGNDSPTHVGTKSASPENNWSFSWTGLPKYYQGKEIVYTVAELPVAGYTASQSISETGVITIKNTHAPATIDIPVIKRWIDGNHGTGGDADHPGVTIRLHKTVDGVAKEVDFVELSHAQRSSHTFVGLPLYESGKPIEYFVTEDEVEGYDSHIGGSMEGGFSVVNTRQHTSLHGVKTWDDANDQDGMRPESILVTLWKQTEGSVPEKADEQEVFADNNGEWKYTFSNLHVYEDGKLVTYSVTESLPNGTSIEGYTLANANDSSGHVYAEENAEGTLTANLVNKHEPIVTSISGTKTWVDDNNEAGKRPESITVRLFADGVEVDSIEVTEGADGSWSYAFVDVPMYADGKMIEYSVKEDAVDGYVTKVDSVSDTSTGQTGIFNITNTLEDDEPLPDTGDDSNGNDEALPKTGDEATTRMALISLLATLAAVVATASFRKARLIR